jgi:hypothetical protein
MTTRQVPVAAVAAAAGVGILTAASPLAAAAVTGLVLAIIVLPLPRVRLLLVVFGAVVAFQSSGDVGALKLAYLGLLGAVLALTFRDRPPTVARSVLSTSAVTALVLLALMVRSVAVGNDASLVVRDGLAYLMLCAAAPLAVHFGRRCHRRYLLGVAIVVGGIGGVAWSVEFAVRRHLVSLPALGLPSPTMGAMSVALCVAMATRSRKAVWWWALASAQIAIALASGSRNAFLAVVPILSIGTWQAVRVSPNLRRRALRAVRVAVFVVPVFAVSTFAALSAAGFSLGDAWDRLATITQIGEDEASLEERRIQQSLAWDDVREAPALGVGPGVERDVPRPTSGIVTRQITLDTSLVVPAKWGILGSAAVVLVLWRWWSLLRPRRSAPTVWGVAVIGLAPWFLAQSVLAPLVEDKGFPMVLVLLGAGVLAERRIVVAGPDEGSGDRGLRAPTVASAASPARSSRRSGSLVTSP